jgi:uncharacterized protein
MFMLQRNEPVAVALFDAIHTGDLASLQQLLAEHPGLAAARIADDKGASSTPLHAATDWPGYFPNGPAVVAVLLALGADPNAPIVGSWHSETPLHWAASSDDVDVAEALIAGGADLNWIPDYAKQTPLDVAAAPDTGREALVNWLREKGAASAGNPR